MPDYERDELGSMGSCQTHRAAVGAGHVERNRATGVRSLLPGERGSTLDSLRGDKPCSVEPGKPSEAEPPCQGAYAAAAGSGPSIL